MDTEIKNAVSATEQDAQYDDKAKRLLGNKIILAHILVKTVDEFRGMNPQDVVSYIEGEPFISVVPVEPGLTNVEKILSDGGLKNGQRIVGLNTENMEINEGLIRFDIIFYVRMKDGSAMCNLSQGIREKGGAEREEKIILNMHREGYTSEQIAKVVEKTIGEVEAIINRREPARSE